MNKIDKRELEEKEKEEIRKMVDETTAIYEFLDTNEVSKKWMNDSERFIGFTFVHTKYLVKHSITLTNLTRWLIGLTIGLLVLTLGNIFIILNNTYRWL